MKLQNSLPTSIFIQPIRFTLLLFFWLASISTFSMAYAADLEFSVSSDRSAPSPLDGSNVNGDVYIFVPDTGNIQNVVFSLNGTIVQTENNSPYDFAGTNRDTSAKVTDTTQWVDGSNTISATVNLVGGGVEQVSATFIVANNGPGLIFNPGNFSLIAAENGAPIEQLVSLSTTDANITDFNLNSDSSWLTVNPSSGTTPNQFSIFVDPTGLQAGIYTGRLTATSTNTGHTNSVLIVNFSVTSDADADQIHLGWIGDPATTMTVVWRTLNANSLSEVEYRTVGSSTWLLQAGALRSSGTAGTLHEVTLTSLIPATTYEYRVRNPDNSWSNIFTTQTAPASGPADFDFIYVADTGLIGRTDGLATGTEQIINEIANINPTLVLPGGDYAYFNTDKRFGTLDNSIDEWFNQMMPISTSSPLMPTYGNHETLLGENIDSWISRFPTPNGFNSRRFYSFDIGDVHFVSILAVSNSSGVTQSELDWIEQDIVAANNAGQRWVIPYFHVAPFSDGTNHPSNLGLRNQFGPLFESLGVKIVLTSHDQSYERTFPLVDVPATNTPTTQAKRCYTFDEGTSWIKVSPGGKLSNISSTFSPFNTDPQPPWTAYRDNTMHHFAHLTASSQGSLQVDILGVFGDGTAPVTIDSFQYTTGTCAPELTLGAEGLSFNVQTDSQVTQDISISTTDNSVQQYTITSDSAWLSATPANGQTPSTISVSIDATGLPAGRYSGILTATANTLIDDFLTITLTVSDGNTFALFSSNSADRSNPVDLNGTIESGNMFVFINPESNIKRVIFSIDGNSTPFHTENSAPFDLNGGTVAAANAFDTTTLSDGDHSITAEVQLNNGSTEFASATFTVTNNAPVLTFNSSNLNITAEENGVPVGQAVTLSTSDTIAEDFTFSSNVSWVTVSPSTGTTPSQLTVTADPTGLTSGTYSGLLTATSSSSNHLDVTLPVTFTVGTGSLSYELISTSADRSTPVSLSGVTVIGDIFVSINPETDVDRVIFSIDGNSTPFHAENSAPFDLNGGTVAAPNAFDTTTLSDGDHSITAEVQLNNGSTEFANATFTVTNNAPALTFNSSNLNITAEENGVPVGQAVTLSTSDTIAEDFTFSNNVSWLTVNPSTGTTPSQLTVTADPTGLTSGTYSGLLTATSSSSNYLDVTLPVTFTVGTGSPSYELISTNANRSTPVSLTGVTVIGDIFVTINPETDVDRVIFSIDGNSTPFHTENSAPFDLNGGTVAAPNAFDTTTLSDGDHSITAEVQLNNGSTEFASATFTVTNNAPVLTFNSSNLNITAEENGVPVGQAVTLSTSDTIAEDFTFSSNVSWVTVSPSTGTTPSQLTVTADPTGLASGTYSGLLTATSSSSNYLDVTLPVTFTVGTGSPSYELISTNADRSTPVSLTGVTVIGDIFVTINPETDVDRVIFSIDGNSTPFHTENSAPFDLNGGTVAAPNAFDTTTLSDGDHSITAEVQLNNGSTEFASATFTVANNAPSLAFNPANLSLSADQGSAVMQQAVTLDTTDSLTADFDLTSNTAWLTVSPSSGATPGQLTLTIDPSGLQPGTYSGLLTANSINTNHLNGSLSVSFTVNSSGMGSCFPLECSQILIDLPYVLDFNLDHGFVLDSNSVGTGFTYIDQPSVGSGYLPDNLEVDLTSGTLKITTTSGLRVRDTNSLDNALGVGIDVPSQISVISAKLLNIPLGTGSFEQGGLWFGVDEDNYIKLDVTSTSSGTRIEHVQEVAGIITAQKKTGILSLTGANIEFQLRVDPVARTVSSQYSINNSPFEALETTSPPDEFFSFDAAGIDPEIGTRSFGGIFASHRNGSQPLIYTFDNFSVVEGTAVPQETSEQTVDFNRISATVPIPTSMVWGPDDRLYVTELFGVIHALTFDANYQVIEDEVINTLGNRLTLGITIDPASTAQNIILWVAHSSPSANNGVPNSSTVTRLSGADFTTVEDIITGLPRAIANHAINSIHFAPDGRLFIAVGGNTGAGAPPTDPNTEFGLLAEQPLSAALLVADVSAPGFDGSCDNSSDIFGLPPCDVVPYSTGLRNTYDFIFHSNGNIYGPDNGLGVTGTFPPVPDIPCLGMANPASVVNGGQNPGTQPDVLNRFEEGKYYGHPNQYRGAAGSPFFDDECVFKDGSLQGVAPLPNYEPPLHILGVHKSSNGIIEYNFQDSCGLLHEELLIANFSVGDDITRIRLSTDGLSVEATSSLVSGFNDPLPLAMGPSGVVFVGEFSGNSVTTLIPVSLGCWELQAPLLVELFDPGSAGLNGELYVVAGKTLTQHLSTLYIFNPVSNTWRQSTNLPGPAVENPAVAASNGLLYSFGGSTSAFSGAVNNAAVFDPATSVWTTIAPMPTSRGGARAEAIGGLIYVIGGMDATGTSLDIVETYDPSTNTWSSVSPMTTRRDNPGSAILNGNIYVFGGRTRNANGSSVDDTLKTVEMFDANSNTWISRTPMPTGRRTMVVGTLNGRAQVIGGERAVDGSSFKQNEEYDPLTNSWRVLNDMLTPRHGAAAATIGDFVYVAGGAPTGGAAVSDINDAFKF